MDADRTWISGPDPDRPGRMLLVARTHGVGLQAAEAALRQWAASTLDDTGRPNGPLAGVKLLGLVLVDDAPKLTTNQRRSCARVAAMAPASWRLPWAEELRAVDDPAAPTSRAVRKVGRLVTERARRTWRPASS